MKHVAILGCGPQGLLTAWAVRQAGHVPHIISHKVKSRIPGSQHLHGPVLGITSQYPEGTIHFIRMGTAEGYASKVYGDAERYTGWEHYFQLYPSWNVLDAYDKLWLHFEDQIKDETLEGSNAERLREITLGHDLTISTLPSPALCTNPDHVHHGVPYYIKTLPTPPADANHEIVVYNGLPEDPWYRWSILGGLCSVEYMKEPFPFDDDIIEGTKAHHSDCNCYSRITRLGRWSQWKHGVTLYSAYQEAVKLMEEL